jgi:ABC-type transport system substrate-binding protein
MAFSILRLADERNHSPGYWLIRGKIKGIGAFRAATAESAPWDFSPYDAGCEGIRVLDDRTLGIRLEKPDPRFLYAFAMPYMSVAPREAVEAYRGDFSSHPVGSGPFRLVEWRRGYKLEFERNPDFRTEYFRDAENPADCSRKLPLLERVVCPQVNEPVTAWLMFLRGDLDMNSVDKDSFDAVVAEGGGIAPALAARGVRMIRSPKMQIYYIGFCFADPLLAENADLRKAIR